MRASGLRPEVDCTRTVIASLRRTSCSPHELFAGGLVFFLENAEFANGLEQPGFQSGGIVVHVGQADRFQPELGFSELAFENLRFHVRGGDAFGEVFDCSLGHKEFFLEGGNIIGIRICRKYPALRRA